MQLPKHFFFSLSLHISLLLIAQKMQAQDYRQQLWLTYHAQQQLSKHWGYQFDVNHRLADVQQPASIISAVRVGGTYFTSKRLRLTAGYAWFGTHTQLKSHGLIHENRLWQQALWQYQLPKSKAMQRIRLEQRWREQISDAAIDHRFSVRFRYMWQWQHPIWHSSTHPQRQLMLHAADEWMLHAGEDVGKHFFDQNRLMGGIAYAPNKHMEIHLLYQQITQYQAAKEGWQHLHTIRLTLQQVF
jgi:hypothetical protein